MRDEVVVAGLEVSIAKEAVMSGEWRGMRRFENEVLRWVNKGGFVLRVGAPQKINKIVAARGKRTNDGVSKSFPALALVRASHIRSARNGQGRIQKKYALIGPMRKISIAVLEALAIFGFELLVDVAQGRRQRDAMLNGEREPMRLVWIVIRILPEQDNFYLVDTRTIERLKDELARRIDDAFCVSILYKRDKVLEVFTFKLIGEERLPRFFDIDVHCLHQSAMPRAMASAKARRF